MQMQVTAVIARMSMSPTAPPMAARIMALSGTPPEDPLSPALLVGRGLATGSPEAATEVERWS